MFTRVRVAPLLAELLGTGLWVMVALVMSETTAVSYFIATSVALALAVAYMTFYAVSGSHFNPAITFGMWTARRMTTLRAVCYIIAQLIGAVVALWLYQYLAGHHLTNKTTHYTGQILVAEAVGTMILAWGYAAAAYRAWEVTSAALTVGAALFVAVLVAATASAGYLNPAVALGEKSFSWAYVLGPLVGGLVGVNIYNYLFMNAPMRVVRTTRVLSTKKK